MCSHLCVFVWVKKPEIESDSPMFSHSGAYCINLKLLSWKFLLTFSDDTS